MCGVSGAHFERGEGCDLGAGLHVADADVSIRLIFLAEQIARRPVQHTGNTGLPQVGGVVTRIRVG